MKMNLSEITILHDCCTAVNKLGDQVVRGYEKLLSSQNYENAETRASMISYCGNYEILFENLPAGEVKIGELKPCKNGEHPIIDSIAGAINDLGQRYSNTDESLRPEKVIFVIVAVGKDNASRHFTYRDIYTIIKHQSDVYNWKFFLLTDDDSLSKQLGISDDDAILLDIESDRFFENGINDLNERINSHRA